MGYRERRQGYVTGDLGKNGFVLALDKKYNFLLTAY
jgi:hypothetical protein